MQYVLAIKSHVYGSQGAYLAYQFANALIRQKHSISQVFFFQDGVNNANVLVNPATDEINLMEKWQTFSHQHQVPLHLCISAAQRRGITEQNLAKGFTLAGLGEFSKAVLEADRLMSF